MELVDLIGKLTQLGVTGLLGLGLYVVWGKYQMALDDRYKLLQDRVREQTELLNALSKED